MMLLLSNAPENSNNFFWAEQNIFARQVILEKMFTVGVTLGGIQIT